MADPNDRVNLATDEARGASTPGVGRYVLAASTALIIIAFIIVYLVV